MPILRVKISNNAETLNVYIVKDKNLIKYVTMVICLLRHHCN